jgi:hypothetical protein
MRRVLLAVAMVASCSDPLHSDRVDALGPEASGVSPGPTHRPGQPCLTCHGGEGPGATEFAVAGTVYQTPDVGSPPAVNANVSLIDAPPLGGSLDGTHTVTTVTNSAGNFYLAKSQYSPVFPLRVEVTIDGLAEPTRMTTHIGRDGGCGSCHFDPKGPKSPGHVYLVADPADLPGAKP